MKIRLALFLICLTFVYNISVYAQKEISVLVNKPIAKVQPTLWGVFFEDINFAADGGIYAELVKNRSFEFYEPLMGWKEVKQNGAKGKILILNREESHPANPRFVRITSRSENGAFGFSNEGFRGMGVKKDVTYNFSVIARKRDEGNLKLRIELVDSAGKILGTTSLTPSTKDWKKYTAAFQSNARESHARLRILLEGKGILDMDMVSLFPQDTWKNRPNGLRADLVQMMADMKPGFVRFPGGCIVEGHHLAVRYQWKKTVGDVNDRELIVNRWNSEFMHRHTPDYYQSFGLGFYEYFLLAEDLGAEPLPILNCGMACQFNTAEVVPLNQLEPYIQDALDLIEFANGSVTSEWGKLRAEMDHPDPFNLKYLGIGNEQWGEQYIERYKLFSPVIRKKYPGIKLVSCSGPPWPKDNQFEYLWGELTKLKTDIVDEHYYRDPDWFFSNANLYDDYDRNGPKVFVGEYAAHTKEDKYPTSRNTWLSALAEAAFMTGMERNAGVVYMSAYAPLFAHIDAWQWRPDLIWFDNLHVLGTPNYYVQKLFSTNTGTHTVSVLHEGQVLAGKDSLYASATIDKHDNSVFVKLVNNSSTSMFMEIKLQGANPSKKTATAQVLTAPDLMAYNSLENPKNVYPLDKELKVSGKTFNVTLDPKSLTVLQIPCKELLFFKKGGHHEK